MSVASTKAFYAQIVAGYLLALFFAKTLGSMPEDTILRQLEALEHAPSLMNRVLRQDRRNPENGLGSGTP